jgi:hypothetical protein
MTFKKILFGLAIATALVCAQATPIEIDMPEAHIVVIRPSDIWSGDASSMEKNLDAIKAKKFSFSYNAEGIRQNGNPMLFGSLSNHPVVQGVVKAIEKEGWSLGHSENRHSLWIDQPVAIKPVEMTNFIAAQNEYFQNFVISQGAPSTLQTRTGGKKILGAALAVGALAIATNKFGVDGGTHFTLGSGMTDSIYKVSYEQKGVITPTFIENIDLSKYEHIDVRKVRTMYPDRLGQIIIAYKQAKTTEIENKLMINAILVLASVGADLEEIEKNRAADFDNRQSIWSNCSAWNKPECRTD